MNVWRDELYSLYCLLTVIIAHFNSTYNPSLSPSTHSSLQPFFPAFQRVKHHNILQLVDAFETKKEYFLFLEL